MESIAEPLTPNQEAAPQKPAGTAENHLLQALIAVSGHAMMITMIPSTMKRRVRIQAQLA